MAYDTLRDFIAVLEKNNELVRIKAEVDAAEAGPRGEREKLRAAERQQAAQDDLKNVEVTMTQDGDTIRVVAKRTDQRVDIGNSGASAELSVPNGTILDLRSSNGSITTDLALPLGTSVGDRPNEFDVRASGPNLRLLVPDAPNSAVVNQKFDLRAKGLWNRDSWA